MNSSREIPLCSFVVSLDSTLLQKKRLESSHKAFNTIGKARRSAGHRVGAAVQSVILNP